MLLRLIRSETLLAGMAALLLFISCKKECQPGPAPLATAVLIFQGTEEQPLTLDSHSYYSRIIPVGKDTEIALPAQYNRLELPLDAMSDSALFILKGRVLADTISFTYTPTISYSREACVPYYAAEDLKIIKHSFVKCTITQHTDETEYILSAKP